MPVPFAAGQWVGNSGLAAAAGQDVAPKQRNRRAIGSRTTRERESWLIGTFLAQNAKGHLPRTTIIPKGEV